MSIINIEDIKLPPNAVFLSDYTFVQALNRESCNEISIYQQMIPDESEMGTGELVKYFFKRNSQHSHGPAIEAISAGFCELIVPNGTVSEVKIVLEKTETGYRCIGTLSRELQNLVPVSRDGLRKADLINTSMASIDFSVMEDCHDKFMAADREKKRLQRREAFAKQKEKQESVGFEPVDLYGEVVVQDESKDDVVMENFYENIAGIYGVSREKFDSYEVVRSLATVLVMAIINQNGDFHRNNYTKKGELFDFDMTMWPILAKYKDGFIVNTFRQPTKKMFRLSEIDILNFPVISSEVSPPFWPSDESIEHVLPESLVKGVKTKTGLAENTYTESEVNLFRGLMKNPVFIHFKYATFLRFILTTPGMYEAVIRENLQRDSSNDDLIARIIQNQFLYHQHYQRILPEMPEFRDFFRMHGESVLKQYFSELRDAGIFSDTDFPEIEASLRREFVVLSDIIHQMPDDTKGFEVINKASVSPYEFKNDDFMDECEIISMKDVKDLKKAVIKEDFGRFRDMTLHEMKSYSKKRLGLISGTRHNETLAQEITIFCNKLDANDPEASLVALYQFLCDKLKNFSGSDAGKMHSKLQKLIGEMEKCPLIKDQHISLLFTAGI